MEKLADISDLDSHLPAYWHVRKGFILYLKPQHVGFSLTVGGSFALCLFVSVR